MRLFWVCLELTQDGYVVEHRLAIGFEVASILDEEGLVVPDFFAKIFSGLMQEVAMVNELDGLFEADGDEQADDDGGDVDEEVSPGGGGMVRRMDFEHGGRFLWGLGDRGGGFGGWGVFGQRGVFGLRRLEW